MTPAGTTQRRARIYRWFQCHACPESWSPWREGGEATAEKHAKDMHRAPFSGEFQDRKRAQWLPGDGRPAE